jgi:protein-disulfide isomerase
MMGLPLASWGALFYSALALLGFGVVIFWRDCGRVYLRWVLYLAGLGLTFDLYLAYVLVFRIQTACWLCVSTYVINVVIILMLLKSVWKEPKPRAPMRAILPGTKDAQGIDLYYRNAIKGLLIGGILFTSVVGVAGSQFISKSLTGDDRERLVKLKTHLAKQPIRAVYANNRPVMGADDGAVTVVEFRDFLCPYCAKASKYLKLAESSSHDTARFMFRHYPLDKSCNRGVSSNMHPGACLLAEGSACANEQNRFWEYHDIAFETKGKISQTVVMDIASSIGLDLSAFKSCLNSGRGLRVVKEDINAAIQAGVRSTPTLFINGRGLRGVPKPWMLNEILRYSKKNLAPPE